MVSIAEYKHKKEVYSRPVAENIFCYAQDEYINGTKVGHKEGFTKNPEITPFTEIQQDNSIMLFKKEVLDLNISSVGGFYGLDYDKQKEYFEENPYTYMSEHPDWEKDHIVLNYIVYSGDLAYLDGTYVPKAITFSELDGNVTNAYYDLEAVLEYVKKHERCKVLVPDILDIPYYNATRYENQYVYFIYKPTQEEYNDWKKQDKDRYHKYEIVKKILELEQFRLPSSEQEED